MSQAFSIHAFTLASIIIYQSALLSPLHSWENWSLTDVGPIQINNDCFILYNLCPGLKDHSAPLKKG